MIPFELPLRHGTDYNDSAIQAAPVTRVVVDPPSLVKEGEALLASANGQVISWVLAQRAAYHAGVTQQFSTTGSPVVGVTVIYTANQGTETIDIIVTPPGNPHRVLDLEAGDVWKIGTDDTSLPFPWGGVNVTKTVPQALNDMIQAMPTTGTGYGSGIYTKALKDKTYWEVEITDLPTDTPEDYQHATGGEENCEYTISPISEDYATRRVYKWPKELNSLMEPIIGLVPDGWVDADAKKKERFETTDFLAHILPDGADPEARPITVVRTSVMEGMTTSHRWHVGGYYADYGDDGKWGLAPANPVFEHNPCIAGPADIDRVWSTGDVIGRDDHVYQVAAGAGVFAYGKNAPPYDDDHYHQLTGLANAGGPTFDSSRYTAERSSQDASDFDPFGGRVAHGDVSWVCMDSWTEYGQMWNMVPDLGWYAWNRDHGGIPETCMFNPLTGETTCPDVPGGIYKLGSYGGTVSLEHTVEEYDKRPYFVGQMVRRFDTVKNNWIYGRVVRERSQFVDTTTGPDKYGDTNFPNGKMTGHRSPVIKGVYNVFVDDMDTPHDDIAGAQAFWTGADFGELKKGDILMFAVDVAKRKVWVGKNGQWANGGQPASGIAPLTYLDGDNPKDVHASNPVDYYPICSYMTGKIWMKMRFGGACKHQVPAGFKALGGIDFQVPLD